MSIKTLRFNLLLLLMIGLIQFSISATHQCQLEFTFSGGAAKGSCVDSKNGRYNCLRSSCGVNNKRFALRNGCTRYGTRVAPGDPTQQQCEQYSYPSGFKGQILCINGAGDSYLCPATTGSAPFFTCTGCDN
ncbi:secreted protein [Melampsora americana]|nr:secreted protein [Melampsora americana]